MPGRPLPPWIVVSLPLVFWMSLPTASCTDPTSGPKRQPGLRTGAPPEAPSGATSTSPAEPGEQADWETLFDPALGFRLRHPRAFVVRPQPASRLAGFAPAPLASIYFMNPTMAAGELAGIEPPDLDVRVYRAGNVESLQSWLLSARFVTSDLATAQPFRVAGASGLRLCQSTMIAPGCSVFLLHEGRVYQLTPASLEGEAMIETFTPAP